MRVSSRAAVLPFAQVDFKVRERIARVPLWGCRRHSMARAKDVLAARDYSKILRGNMSACVKEDYSKTDLDEVVACFKDFLLDVAGRTPRMNEAPLRAGIMHAFERVTASEAELCANRLSKAFQYCQDKARSATAGKKLQGTIGKPKKQKTKSMEAMPQAPDPPRSSNTKMASPGPQTRREALPQRVRCRSKTPETKRCSVDFTPEPPAKRARTSSLLSPNWSMPATPVSDSCARPRVSPGVLPLRESPAKLEPGTRLARTTAKIEEAAREEQLATALKKPAASASTNLARTSVKIEEAAREEQLVPQRFQKPLNPFKEGYDKDN